MTLAAGSKLGPYEIKAPLGAGGMGEVYRACDTRLERTVAIKILPAQFSSDPVRKQRFEREAKIISSLNHPHICVLHDIGHQGGIDYLVLECVEGETLAKRLTKGALPLEQVLKCGAQIADALDKAHRKGVVHRDIKPGNIMLTPTGAKLLDFGLAKPVVSLLAGATLTAATPSSVTERGTIVGTFQYMSPEQIEGKELDGRSDIFSLGGVLYEMLTSQKAFQGKSQLSVASAILEKEPAPISSIKPLTPPAVDHAIKKCLAKLPDQRWQSAGDLASELTWIAEAGSLAGMPAPVLSHRKGRERLAWVVAAMLGIALALAAAGWWRVARTSPVRLPMRLTVELPLGTNIDRFGGADVALSPDGTRIALVEADESGTWRIVVRRMDQSEFTLVRGAEDVIGQPFFSPDGQWLGFFAQGKLKKVPVQGGEAVTLCDVPRIPRGASWGDDGNIIVAFNQGSTGLVRVPAAGGNPVHLTEIRKEKGQAIHAWPQALPRSHAVLFTVHGSERDSPDDAEIQVLSLKTGAQKTLYRGGFYGRYLPGGYLGYLRQNTLFVAPFDLSRLEVTAAPQPMLEDVSSSWIHRGDFDFSQTGILAYVSSKGPPFRYQISWLDSTSQTKPLYTSPGLYENPRFSPDGKRLAFEVATTVVRADIWARDLERDTLSRLTHLPGRNNFPLWTPDGKSIVFTSAFQEAPGIYWLRADGSGEAQRLIESKTLIKPSSFSPDGKWLAYAQWKPDGNAAIWTARVEGDGDHPRLGKADALLETSFDEGDPAFSPDGHWLAYDSNESGTYEVYVQPFPGPGGKSQVSSGGGGFPIWSRNGRELFFLQDLHIMVADYAARGDSFTVGKPRVWSHNSLAPLADNYPYDLAPDGKRFAVVTNPAATQEHGLKPTDSVIVLMNFFDELRRNVPSGKN